MKKLLFENGSLRDSVYSISFFNIFENLLFTDTHEIIQTKLQLFSLLKRSEFFSFFGQKYCTKWI